MLKEKIFSVRSYYFLLVTIIGFTQFLGVENNPHSNYLVSITKVKFLQWSYQHGNKFGKLKLISNFKEAIKKRLKENIRENGATRSLGLLGQTFS
jgi:hypothetical protein